MCAFFPQENNSKPYTTECNPAQTPRRTDIHFHFCTSLFQSHSSWEQMMPGQQPLREIFRNYHLLNEPWQLLIASNNLLATMKP